MCCVLSVVCEVSMSVARSVLFAACCLLFLFDVCCLLAVTCSVVCVMRCLLLVATCLLYDVCR